MSIIPAYKVTLGYSPEAGARALQVPLNFNSLGVTQINFDTFKEQATGQIEFIQCVFIDNSQNAQGLALRFPALGQVITVRTQMVGYFPIFVPNGAFACTAVTLGNVNLNLIFSNIFINPTVWQSA
jgi:hypothetical protein